MMRVNRGAKQRTFGGLLLSFAFLLLCSACDSNNEQRARAIFVGQDTPSWAELEFASSKKLPKVSLHIDNRKLRIWNSAYLPFGTELDSAYLRMSLSNQLPVTLFNETTGKRHEWLSSDTGKIDITGGKLQLTIHKENSPTINYQIRIMSYGYDPTKISWRMYGERLPQKSDQATVLEQNGVRYWLTRVPKSDISVLYRIKGENSPFTFEKSETAQLPLALVPESILRDHQQAFWGLNEEGELFQTQELQEWQKVELGTTRLTHLISDTARGEESTSLTAIGYEVDAPNHFFTYLIKDNEVTKGKALPNNFPVRNAYIYTYQVAGSTHSNIFSGYTPLGVPATSSFFTSDGISWGEAPYNQGATSNQLPVKGGLFLNPMNHKDLFVVGGIYKDGASSNHISVSHNRGNTWEELTKEQAPGAEFRPRYGASGVVMEYVGGLPQFYIFGGNIEGEPTDEIWHGWLDTTGGIVNSFEN